MEGKLEWTQKPHLRSGLSQLAHYNPDLYLIHFKYILLADSNLNEDRNNAYVFNIVYPNPGSGYTEYISTNIDCVPSVY